MEKRRLINPMPENLEDTKISPNDFIDPTQAVNIPPSAAKQEELNRVLTGVTEEMIQREILDQKIIDDIENAKKNPIGSDSKTPREVLKSLISRGEYKEDVEILGNVWTMRALSQGDLVLAFNDIKDDTATMVGRVTALGISQIAYSVDRCNGVSIYDWFGDFIKKEDFSSTDEFRLAVRRTFRRYLEKMASSTIQEFSDAYNRIEKKRNEALLELKK